jgi:hypothetical protein
VQQQNQGHSWHNRGLALQQIRSPAFLTAVCGSSPHAAPGAVCLTAAVDHMSAFCLGGRSPSDGTDAAQAKARTVPATPAATNGAVRTAFPGIKQACDLWTTEAGKYGIIVHACLWS